MFEGKKYDFWEFKNIIYAHDSAIKNGKLNIDV